MSGQGALLKEKVIAVAREQFSFLRKVQANERLASEFLISWRKKLPRWTDEEIFSQMQHDAATTRFLLSSALADAKTVIFSTDQAAVFRTVTANYSDALDYTLPFPSTLIQYSKPLPFTIFDDSRGGMIEDEVSGLLLVQKVVTEELLEQMQEQRATMEAEPLNLLDMPRSAEQIGAVLNSLTVIYSDLSVFRMGWISGSEYETMGHESYSDSDHYRTRGVLDQSVTLKNLAIACIGYINCENIYLHQEGGAPEKVNRKREARGKSRLEPYYVCRVRGVNYDSVATGEGTAHSIRYDVRGHFRRMTTGKTIWVRPHQRGLQNELYVPKVYKVDERSKPAWTTPQSPT